jgi:hypothetical protein
MYLDFHPESLIMLRKQRTLNFEVRRLLYLATKNSKAIENFLQIMAHG